MQSSADLYVGDLDFGEVLPVPSVAAIAGAAREAENPDLLALAVPHDFGGDLRALDLRRARLDALPVARHENGVERHLVPGLGVEQRHLDRHSGLRSKLGTTGREDCVTHRARNLNWANWLVKPRHTVRSRRDPPAAPSS